MLIRVRSSKGTSRLEVAEDATVFDLAQKAACDLNVTVDEVSISFDFQGDQKVEVTKKTLNECGIDHGAMVYVSVVTPPSVSSEGKVNEGDEKEKEQHKEEAKDYKEQRGRVQASSDVKDSSSSIGSEIKEIMPPSLLRQDTDEDTKKLIEQLQKEDQEATKNNGPISPQVRAPDPSRRMNLLASDPIDDIGGTRWLGDDAFDPLRYGIDSGSGLGTSSRGVDRMIDESVAKELLASGVSEYDIMLMTQRLADEEIAKRYQEQDMGIDNSDRHNDSNRSGMSDLEQARALHRQRMQAGRSGRNQQRRSKSNNDRDSQEQTMMEVDKILSRVTSTANSMRKEFSIPPQQRQQSGRRMPHRSRFDESLGDTGASSASSLGSATRVSVRDAVDNDNDDILQQLLMDGVLQETAGGDYERSAPPAVDYTRLEREWRDEVNRLNVNVDTTGFEGHRNAVGGDGDTQMQQAIEDSVKHIDTEYERALAASMVDYQPMPTIQGEVSIINLGEDSGGAGGISSNENKKENENEDELLAKALAASMKDF